MLAKSFWQSVQVVRRVKPDVVVGLGGYITFPAGMASVMLGKPLVLHEQNSVAGMANRVLAALARRVFTAFPGALKKGAWVGNPLRPAFVQQLPPHERLASRTGPLRLLVVGGSLGAKALNDIVPKALALIPADVRPNVVHQSGAKQIDELRANYAAAGVLAECTPFIDNTAQAYADADIIVCRAGASTVTEIAAVGAAAVFVPFPAAVDDHQTTNAKFLVDAGGGWLVQQRDLTPEGLAKLLRYRSQESPEAWKALLYRIATNVAHDQHRAGASRQNSEHVPLDDLPIADSEHTPEQRAVYNQQVARVSEAILALPPKCQRVYLLKRAHGLSHAQVAARCGISVKMVEKHLANAMALLRHKVGNSFTDTFK